MVPLIGSMRDFHSLVIAPCRAHKAKSPGLRRGKTPIGNSRSTYKTHRTELSKKDQAILSPTVIGEGGADYQLVLTYNWNCYFGCFISGALYRFGIQNQYLDCTTYSGSSSLYKNLGIRQQCFATLFSARTKMVFCWGKK